MSYEQTNHKIYKLDSQSNMQQEKVSRLDNKNQVRAFHFLSSMQKAVHNETAWVKYTPSTYSNIYWGGGWVGTDWN